MQSAWTGVSSMRLRRPAHRYGVAVVLSVAALLATVSFREMLSPSLFIPSFLALSISAWLGGLGPGLLATALAVLGVDYFVLAPVGTLRLSSAGDIIPLAAFAAVGTLISSLSGAARRSEIGSRERAAEQAKLTHSLELANAELQRNRAFLEQAQRLAELGSWDWDIASNRVIWSDQMYRTYGLTPGEKPVSLETFLEAVHPEDRARVAAAVDVAFQTQRSFMFEHRVVWPDGTVRWLHSRGNVEVGGDGTTVRMAGSGQDITDRRRTAEAQAFLVEASATLASSVDYNATLTTVANLAVRAVADWCSVAIGDASGTYENLVVAHRDPARVQQALEYNRLHPPRVETTGVSNVLRTGRTEFYADITTEMLEASTRSPAELKLLRELGIRSAIIAPMIARGRTLGAITFIASESGHQFTEDDVRLAEGLASRAAMAIDTARLVQEAFGARADAEAANRAKMDFLASMSHELRTPLNAIGGYAELLEMGVHGPLSAAQQEAIARIQRSQRNLHALVEDILSFAKIEAGKTEFELGLVTVHDVLTRLGELVAPQVQAQGLRYEYAECDPELSVYADRERAEQILINLLTNAIKFTPPDGRIMLAVEATADDVAIRVTDSGVGIPPDKLEAIFQPFVQLPHRMRGRPSGIGLGLAISRDLARAMNGEIVASSAAGGGSTFTLRLPRSPGASRSDPLNTAAETLPSPA